MNPIHLWKPLVWKFQYDFPQERLISKLNDLKEKIILPSSLEIGDAFSTVSVDEEHRPHFWEELKNFNNFLQEKIAFLWDEYEFKMKNHSHIQESWFNVHANTGTTLEHYHNNINFVITSYIKLPKNSGYIEFRDPLEYHWSNTPIIPEQKLWTEVKCKTNDVLIFPGWLRHRVQENKSNEERIVLTYNIV